jgi:acetyl-CoA carboxylase biotin carboxyl carrier protein
VSLTAKDVAEILRLLESSSFDELALEIDGMKINLRRGADSAPQYQPSPAVAQTASAVTRAALLLASAKVAQHLDPNAHAVTAPLLGVFYRAPTPGEAPFVELGGTVAAESIVGIIEVMKLMNTVRAGVSGKIVEITAQNGELVEFGEVLMRIRPV